MRKNQLNVVGIDIENHDLNDIVIIDFVRRTVEKPIHMKTASIVLLDKNLEIFDKKVEDFTGLGSISPNTSKPIVIKFSKNHLEQEEFNQLMIWSLAFEKNMEDRVGFSDLDKEVSEATRFKLNKLVKKEL